MENRIPHDKTWNAAPADIPQKPRFQPALMSLAREGNLVLIPSGLDAMDIEAGIFRVAC